MSVYKEGFYILKQFNSQSTRVFNDACDVGSPIKQNSAEWGMLKQLVEWYKDENVAIKRTDHSCTTTISLFDEWAYSDGRKSEKEAEEFYTVTYTSLKQWKNKSYLNPQFRNADGFVTIERMA